MLQLIYKSQIDTERVYKRAHMSSKFSFSDDDFFIQLFFFIREQNANAKRATKFTQQQNTIMTETNNPYNSSTLLCFEVSELLREVQGMNEPMSFV